jgi:hypothetical protein
LFGYILVTLPPPFSPPRALAFQEDTQLLGPEIDPEGWHSQEPVKVKGLLFNNTTAEVEFIVSQYCLVFVNNRMPYCCYFGSAKLYLAN